MIKFIAVDQYGNVTKLFTKYPRKELLNKLGSTHADKMYIDTLEQGLHIGYIINGLALTVYKATYFKKPE